MKPVYNFNNPHLPELPTKNQLLVIHGIGGYLWGTGKKNFQQVALEIGFEKYENFQEFSDFMDKATTYSERCNATDHIKDLIKNGEQTVESIFGLLQSGHVFDFATRHHSELFIGKMVG